MATGSGTPDKAKHSTPLCSCFGTPVGSWVIRKSCQLDKARGGVGVRPYLEVCCEPLERMIKDNSVCVKTDFGSCFRILAAGEF